uniref:Ninja-family protein n=1 Tax=Davidia involucrata TaxID=16924 RepID=A0A5B7BPR9_DAVIN
MDEANQDGVAEILLPLQNNGHPIHYFHSKASEFSNSEPDLNLGLSLGGCYYSRIPKETPLIRSSSLNGVLSLNDDDGEFLSLARSSSLPTETGQEQMKRIGATRRLVVEEIKSEDNASANHTIQGPKNSTVDSGPNNFQAITSEAMANGKSVKPANSWSVPVVTSRTMANGKLVKRAETEEKNPSKKIKASNGGMQDIGMELIMKQMPSVTTTGDGPNGRRIEGFLYKYMKGHVSIVCVCHGNFLSPAEFVEHAGGSEVANPMKHINVLPPSF